MGAQLLVWHVTRAARSVRLEVPGVDADDPVRVLAFGRQVDVRVVSTRRRTDDPGQGLSAEQVAGYLAKYVTKSLDGEDHRAGNDHLCRLRSVCGSLAVRARAAADPESAQAPYARLGNWVHMYGFRGHFASKSRRYSITRGRLQRARCRAQVLRADAARSGRPLDLAALEAELLAEDDDAETTLVVGSWQYAGTGWADETERTLALAAAARAREYAREQARLRKHTSIQEGRP